MVHRGFKDLPRSTDKILHDKSFDIANNPKSDGSQRGFASMAFKIFDRKQKVALQKNLISKVKIS